MDLAPIQAACSAPPADWLADLAKAIPAAGTYVNGQSIVATVAVVLAFAGYLSNRASFRQKNSFDAQRRIISEKEVKSALDTLRERSAKIEKGQGVDSWSQIAADRTHNEFVAATTLLNTFEDLAIGIKLGVFDEKILRHALLTMVLRTMFVTQGFIKERQEQYSYAFQHFQWLHARWGKDVFPSQSQEWAEWNAAEAAFAKAIKETRQAMHPDNMGKPGKPPSAPRK